MKNDPAFPGQIIIPPTPEGHYSEMTYHLPSGLTKREYFAAMAMQGIASSDLMTKTLAQIYSDKIAQGIASAAVEAADALIEKLEEKPEKVYGDLG